MSELDVTIPDTIPQHIIGIGASAGGLETISEFFKQMPTDSDLVFVVVQHLSPDTKSMMSDLLRRVTQMPIHEVTKKVTPLPNNIYLITPGSNLLIIDGDLVPEPQDRSTRMPQLPIDVFLDSLAKYMGSAAVGIILSGTGSDGTRGCRAIKEVGGLAIAQSEKEAKFDGMPSSIISNGLADYILTIAEMPSYLIRYISHPLTTSPQIIEEEFKDSKTSLGKIFNVLKLRFKVDFSSYKSSTIGRRIQRRMSITQHKNLQQYAEFVRNDGDEPHSLFKELLIGVTNFYRDRSVFEHLEHHYLANYLSKVTTGQVRFWVTACSSGEEVYTLCMIFLEICEKQKLDLDLKVFATDIDQQALSRASAGIFPESIVADLSSDMLSKYFIRNGDHFIISRKIREMVVFTRHNILSDPPFTKIDFISCRNLFIYLLPEIQRRVLQSFNFSLNPGGLLLLGNSESLGDADTLFETIDAKDKIFKTLGRARSAAFPLQTGMDRVRDASGWQIDLPSDNTPYERKSSDEVKILESYLDTLSDKFIPFSMLVNDDNEIIRIIGNSRPYMLPLSGRITSNINQLLIKDLQIPITTGLARLNRTNSEVNFSRVRIKQADEIKVVNITIRPMRLARNTARLSVIIVRDTENIQENALKEAYDADRELMQRLNDLEQELQFSRENLQATIEELETSNEELQATNEELLASNEELQSTNEELQSVNEELFTVNAEYQAKISQMTELSDDIENFLAASRSAYIFLDANLHLRRFSNVATKVFNIIDHDIGRPIGHLSHRLNDFDVVSEVQNAHHRNIKYAKVLKNEKGESFNIEIIPYPAKSNHPADTMILITLIDK